MPIVGFNYDKISIERKNQIKQNISVKNDMKIEDIKQVKIPIAKKEEEVLQFNFRYSTEYRPNIAHIEIKGHILFLDKLEETKKIMNEWKKTKKLPANIMGQIINTILIKCGIKALSLSQDLNLPPHIRIPTLAPKVKKEDYIA